MVEKNSSQRLYVIHNLRNISSIAEVKKCIDTDIKKNFNIGL
jgi:hypothetical protein